MIRFSTVFSFALPLFLIAALLFLASTTVASPVKGMRPSAGIGVLMLPVSRLSDDEVFGRLRFYDEPAMSRIEGAELANAPRYEWIFDMDVDVLPMIVTARKGEWLKMTYDDAGREGWVKPWRRHKFVTWDDFFKGRTVRLLSGLQKRYYQLFGQPGAEPVAGVTPQQLFVVILLDNDWAQVLDSRNSPAWLRWRDEDGRLLVGLKQGSGSIGSR